MLTAFDMLQVSEYDLERAIELYFETGGIDLSGSPPPQPPPPPPQLPRHQTPPSRPIIIEDDDDVDALTGQPIVPPDTMDEDEALARRLMQEDIDRQEAQGGPSNDDVRSPIAARNDILVHPDTDYDTQYRFGTRTPRRGILPLTEIFEMLTIRARVPCSWYLQSGKTIHMEPGQYNPVPCGCNRWVVRS